MLLVAQCRRTVRLMSMAISVVVETQPGYFNFQVRTANRLLTFEETESCPRMHEKLLERENSIGSRATRANGQRSNEDGIRDLDSCS